MMKNKLVIFKLVPFITYFYNISKNKPLFPFVQCRDAQQPALERFLCLPPDGLPECELRIVIQDLDKFKFVIGL